MKTDLNIAPISPFILLSEAVKATSQPRNTILQIRRLGQFPKEIRLLVIVSLLRVLMFKHG